MYSLRPHKQFNFVGVWKYGFIISAILIVLSVAGLVTSFATTGSALTLGTEFSGGTSIQITDAGDLTEDTLVETYNFTAQSLGVDSQISSAQTSSSGGTQGFLLRTTDSNTTSENSVMAQLQEDLGINSDNVTIQTISASWGASVIWSSIFAFVLSCVAILIVIALRYREPRMGVVALITLFHDMFIVVGVYAWAGMFFHMEITADVIAALLAIIGYSLYDTIVVFHRINQNSSPNMRMSMKTCANISVNEIIVRSMNTSITSVIPVFFMLLLGTDTLLDFAFAMFIGMVLGVYSTLAISAPVYTLWKCRQPEYARLEKKFPYVVEQSPFTKPMLKQARKDWKKARKEELTQLAADKKEAKKLAAEEKKEAAARRKERAQASKEKNAERKEHKETAARAAEKDEAGKAGKDSAAGPSKRPEADKAPEADEDGLKSAPEEGGAPAEADDAGRDDAAPESADTRSASDDEPAGEQDDAEAETADAADEANAKDAKDAKDA